MITIMKAIIIFLFGVMINFSCNQQFKGERDEEKLEDTAEKIYNEQIYAKIDHFYQYQASLNDTTLLKGICIIDLTTQDPYGFSSVADTFISISMLYCDQSYEDMKGAFIYENKMIVVRDKEDLASIFLSNVDLFTFPKDSITCINLKTKTVFTYIVENQKLKEWIYPFR